MATDFDDIRQKIGEAKTAELIQATAYIPDQKERLILDEEPDFELTKRGRPKQTLSNLKLLLDSKGIAARYNVIKKLVEINGPGLQFSKDNYEEASRTAIISLCHEHELPVSHINEYLTSLADENQFNPIHEWIQSKPWDGKSRMQEWLQTIDTASNDVRDLILPKWAMSCVASWFSSDGQASHIVPVLQGAQGIGKDRWCKNLFPSSMSQYILEGHSVNPQSKDSLINAVRHAITILSELNASNRRNTQDEFKAWITSDEDKIRLPYGRSERVMPRRTTFIATVNELDFLKDDTGNRRFAVLQINEIEPNHGIDMQQLWAETYHLYEKSDQHPWLSQDEIQWLLKHNTQYEETSSVEERIKTKYEWSQSGGRHLTATEICLEIGIINPSRAELSQASKGARLCLGLGREEFSKRGSKGEKLFLMPDLKPDGQLFSQSFSSGKYGGHRE